MTGHLHHVGIVVKDLDAVARMCRDVLGLEDAFETESPNARVAFFSAGGTQLELIEFKSENASAERLPEGASAHVDHLAFEVADVDEVYARIAEQGAAPRDAPRDLGPFRTFFADGTGSLEGVALQFLQPLPGPAPTPSPRLDGEA